MINSSSIVVRLVVVVWLSIVDQSQAGLFGGNNHKNSNDKTKLTTRDRRRLTDVPPLDTMVDVDAATGTVRGEQPQPDLSATCDGQLAQALVAANDAEQQARKERDEALKEREAALAEIVQLESKIQALQGNMGDLQSHQEAEIQTLKAKLTEAASETMAAVAAAEQVKDEMIAKLQAQLEDAKGDIQKEMEAHIEDMKTKMEKQKKEASELLEATKQEAKRVLVEQVSTVKEQLKQAESQAKEALAKKEEDLMEVTAQNERFSKYNTEMLEVKKEYEQELEHWRNTFENRGYCNMTHIGDDIKETTLTAYNQAAQAASVAATKAAEAASVAAVQLNIHSRKLAKEASIHAQYGYQKAVETYDAQCEQHWPKIKPHYDQYVAPHVSKFNQWKAKEVDPKLDSIKEEYLKIKAKEIDPRLKALNTERKKWFAKMVELYGTYCQESYKFSLQMAKEHDFMETFQKVGPHMKDSCDHAERSVTLLLQGMLILALLPFTGRILRFAWSIVRLVFSIFLTVTLLRFILPRGSSSAKKGGGKGQPVPHKVKSNAHVSPNKKKRAQRMQ